MNLFGFEIKKKEEEKDQKSQSFVEPDNLDGAVNVTSAGGIYGSAFLDLEGSAKNEAEVISKYRQMEQYPEISGAIEDITSQAIVIDEENRVVDIVLDDVELSGGIKKRITEEFEEALKLLNFSNDGYEIFSRWYVDGRIRYHVIIDESAPKKGIKELRYVDPRKLRKVKEIERSKDPKSEAILKRVKNEYWIYNDKGFNTIKKYEMTTESTSVSGVKIAKDSIVESNSGILNETNTLILSHLHKAIKPYNQLRMLEDAAVIYRLSRAPERRVFYIDVGNLPKMKAEQYLRDQMVKHKNKLVYDATTGEVRDDRRHMTMLEDFWLPRREGGRGTEITSLQGGQNLGEMDDILYFQKNLYKSLNVPISRMESDSGFSLGRASEITRDELKFSKFVDRLRSKFSNLFDEILERQLVLKNIMSLEEWKEIKNKVRYDFKRDSHFQELKDMEILREKAQTLNDIENFVGKYFSIEWVWKNVLFFSDKDIEEIKKEIAKEEKAGEHDDDEMNGGGGFGGNVFRMEPVKEPEPRPEPVKEPEQEPEQEPKPKPEANTAPKDTKEGIDLEDKLNKYLSEKFETLVDDDD